MASAIADGQSVEDEVQPFSRVSDREHQRRQQNIVAPKPVRNWSRWKNVAFAWPSIAFFEAWDAHPCPPASQAFPSTLRLDVRVVDRLRAIAATGNRR
jgi:hypothetical protein